MGNDKRPLVHNLYESPMKPEEIEAASFAAIDAEAKEHGFSQDEWIVVRRMIHTTADFSLIGSVLFSEDAIESASNALGRRCSIYVDSNMIRSGVSEARLKAVNPAYIKDDVVCHVADKEIADESKGAGLPRSLFAVRKAKNILHGGIAAFGNAPVALLELNRMVIEDGIKPALVIGMPVGFIHVEESKEELKGLGVPYIILEGRRGGSPIAVSVIHSLCAIAAERIKGGVNAV
jgi:precorrin isomerase